MNLFQMATREVDLGALPDEEGPRALIDFGPAASPVARGAVPAGMDDLFDAAAAEYGVDPTILKGIAYAESRFRPDIISGKASSPAGAVGLMQFMPATAKEMGINPLDPVESVFGAAAYLRQSLDKFGGDTERAIASYNWGRNRAAFDRDDWYKSLPAETRNYVGTVLEFADGQALAKPSAGPSKDAAPGKVTAPAGTDPIAAMLPELERINPGVPQEKLRQLAASMVGDGKQPVTAAVDRVKQYGDKGYSASNAQENAAFDAQLQDRLNQRAMKAAPDATNGGRALTTYNPSTEAARVAAETKAREEAVDNAEIRARAEQLPGFVRGMGKGMIQAGGLAAGTVGLAGHLVGSDSLRDWGLERYQSTMRKASAASIAPEFTSISNAGDAMSWLSENSGYVALQAAQAVASGGIGGLVGKQVGQKAIGEVVGMALANGAQTYGSVYGEAVDEARRTGKPVDTAKVLIGATASMAVDTLADKFGLDAVTKAGFRGNVLSRLAKSTGTQMAVQGGTEAAQLVPEEWGAGKDPFREGMGKQYINEAAVGALGGGGPGIVGAINRRADAPQPAPVPRVEDQSTTPQAPPVPPRNSPAGEGEISIADAVGQARAELGGTVPTPGQALAASGAPAVPVAAPTQPAAPAVNSQPATGPLSPQQKQEIARARTRALMDAEPGAAPQVQTAPATTQADVQRLATEARGARDADETRQIEAMVAADEQAAQGKAAATAQASATETQQGQADTLAIKTRQRVVNGLTTAYGEVNGFDATRSLAAIEQQLQTLGQSPLTPAERERTAEALGRAQAFTEANPAGKAAPATTVPDRGADNSSLEAQIPERVAPPVAPAPEPQTIPGVELSTRGNGMLDVSGDTEALRSRLVAAGIDNRAIRNTGKGVTVSKGSAYRARQALTLPAAPAPAPAVTAPEAANANQAPAAQPQATTSAAPAAQVAGSDAAVPAAAVPAAGGAAPSTQAAGVTSQAEPISTPHLSADDVGLAVYQARNGSYDGQGKMSDEDLDLNLEALEVSATRGKLTPERFAASDVGQRLDAASAMAVNKGLRADPVGTIQALRARVKQSSAAAPATGPTATAAPAIATADNATETAPAEAEAQLSKEMPRDLADRILQLTDGARAEPAMATVESVQAAVDELVGADGRLPGGLGSVVVTTSDRIASDWEPIIGPVAMDSESAGRALGFYAPSRTGDPRGGTVFLIADNIPAGQEMAVAAHELMHKHGKTVLGEKGWDLLHETIGGWANAPEGSVERQVYDEAAARVEASRPEGADVDGYATQELFPYALQVATEMGIKPTAMRPITTVQGWLARVRAAIQSVFGKLTGNPKAFNALDMVDLGFAIAQRENPAHAGELDGAGGAQGSSGEISYSRDIQEVIDGARQPGHAPQKVVIGTASVWLVQNAAGAGLDIAGFRHVIDGSAVRHIIKNHYDEKSERSRGLLPMTDQELTRLPEVIANPDKVVLGTTNRLGKQQIAYVKKMEDGSVLYLDEVRTGRKELAAVSARKYPATMNVDTVVSTLHPNARGDGGNGVIVLTPSESGKPGGTGPMFSRAAPPATQATAAAPSAAPTRPSLPAETGFRKVQRVIQDKLNRITVLSNWARDNGIDLSSEADVWGYEARMHGTVATRVEDFREGTVKPVIDRIQKAGFTTEQVAEYLHAAHAQERNAQIASIDPKTLDGSGMTDAEAQAILAKAPQGLAELAREVQSITDSTRQILLDAGIISQEMADAWSEAYKNYVPLKGGDETKQGGVGKGLSVDGRQKRALGHGARDEKIIENILRDHERAIMLAEKNKVGQAMLVLVDELNNPDIATINQPERRRVLKQGTMYEARTPDGIVVDSFTTSAQALRFVQANPDMKLQVKPVKADPAVVSMATPMLQPNEAQVYVKGHAVRVQLNDEGLARAYKHMGVESLTTLMKVNREINAALSKAYTAYNPEFLLKNIARDFTAGLAITSARHGAGVAARAVKNYPGAMAKLIRYGFTGKASPSVMVYRLAGGSTGAAYLGDLQRIGEDVQATFDDARGALATARGDGAVRGVRTAMRKSIKSGLKLIEVLNGAGESAMRLSVFEAMQESGNDLRASASAAKELLNFNRNGEATRTVGGWYLFLNASIQGTAALADAMVHGKHRAQGHAMVAGMAALFYTLAQAQFGGDDEDKKAWERISPDVKAKNLIIRTGADSYITLPMPYGLGAFFGIGNAAHDLQQGKDLDKVALDLVLTFADQFLPVKPYAEGGDTRGLVELVPGVAGGELMRAALRAGVNRSGLGGDIVPDSKFDESRPDHLRAYRSTKTSVYQTIADQLNAASGGTQTQAGLVDVSPETLKYWTRTLTGGAGVFLTDTFDVVKREYQYYANPEDPDREALASDPREIPIVRGFTREEGISDDRRNYLAAAKEVRRADQDRDRAKKMGDEVGWERVEEQRGELLGLVKMMERSSKHIKEIRDEVEEIMLDDSTSMAFKRGQVKKLEAEESGIYREFIDAVAEDRADAEAKRPR